MPQELQRRIAEQRERDTTIANLKLRKKKEADEKSFSSIIDECREKKNRRKLVVTMERILEDEENKMNDEHPLIVKVCQNVYFKIMLFTFDLTFLVEIWFIQAKVLIRELTAHYELMEELKKREIARDQLTKREVYELRQVLWCL